MTIFGYKMQRSSWIFDEVMGINEGKPDEFGKSFIEILYK